jgi:hypothetical protein
MAEPIQATVITAISEYKIYNRFDLTCQFGEIYFGSCDNTSVDVFIMYLFLKFIK